MIVLRNKLKSIGSMENICLLLNAAVQILEKFESKY